MALLRDLLEQYLSFTTVQHVKLWLTALKTTVLGKN